MIILDPLIRIAMTAINIYIWLVIISAIMTWLVYFNVINTSNQLISTIGEFLWRITEPAIRPIRRVMPNLGGIDISPVILILILYFVQMVLERLLISLYS